MKTIENNFVRVLKDFIVLLIVCLIPNNFYGGYGTSEESLSHIFEGDCY